LAYLFAVESWLCAAAAYELEDGDVAVDVMELFSFLNVSISFDNALAIVSYLHEILDRGNRVIISEVMEAIGAEVEAYIGKWFRQGLLETTRKKWKAPTISFPDLLRISEDILRIMVVYRHEKYMHEQVIEFAIPPVIL
jgi:hypothetical protein